MHHFLMSAIPGELSSLGEWDANEIILYVRNDPARGYPLAFSNRVSADLLGNWTSEDKKSEDAVPLLEELPFLHNRGRDVAAWKTLLRKLRRNENAKVELMVRESQRIRHVKVAATYVEFLNAPLIRIVMWDIDDEVKRYLRDKVCPRLGNKAAFAIELGEVVRLRQNFTLLHADCIGLKRINDECGHGAGDMHLRRMGKALQNALRESDVVARIGGDEFKAIIPQISEEDSRKILARIERKLKTSFSFEYNGRRCTFPALSKVGITSIRSATYVQHGKRSSDRAKWAEMAGEDTYKIAQAESEAIKASGGKLRSTFAFRAL